MPSLNRIRNHDNESDIRELFRVTRPEAPSVDVRQMTENNRKRPLEPDSPGVMDAQTPSMLLRLPVGKVASLSALAATILLATWLIGHIVQPKPTFARSSFLEVQKQLEQLKTVQFTMFTTYPDDSDSQKSPKKFRVKILGRNLQRCEVLGKPESFDLMDSTTGQLINVNTINKTFYIIKSRVSTNSQNGERVETKFEGRRGVDFYEELTQVRISDVTYRGVATVNGKSTERFEEQTVNGLTTWTRTTWVDSQSKLPVHIEIRVRSSEPGVKEFDMTQTDFVYDQWLDPVQFSVVPPEGYKVIEGKFYDPK